MLLVGLKPPSTGIWSQLSNIMSYLLTEDMHPLALSSFVFGPIELQNKSLPKVGLDPPTFGFRVSGLIN